MIETVAAQAWVYGHKVGMVGISHSGTSQLFVAKTRPPSLAAITPLSVMADGFAAAAPGGIINEGFALDFRNTVFNGASPFGRGWEQALVDDGDVICEENQLLHLQKLDWVQKLQDDPYRNAVTAALDAREIVPEIDVPVFLAGSWQDELSGPFVQQCSGTLARAIA